MFSLNGKIIIVTGASSGIGKQIAITLSQLGASLILIARNESALSETLSLLQPGDHQTISIDLTDTKKLKEVVTSLKAVDGVVFNAGVAEYLPIKFINEDKLKNIFDINFNSSVFLTQMLLKNKLIKHKGSLVYISSISSKLGVPGTALYASSKAAINAFVKVVASEVAGLSIRANTICPGIVITPMTQKAKEAMTHSEVVNAEKLYPLGYGEPLDIAGLAAYLLCDLSKWVTGSEIIIDGGHTLT